MHHVYLSIIIFFQFVYRLYIGLRLPVDIDYAYLSLYSVVKNNKGEPGRDFEVSWGNKVLGYFLNDLAMRVVRSTKSPRILSHIILCLTTFVVFKSTISIGQPPHVALLAAGIFALASSHIHSVSYSTSVETIVPLLLGLCILTYDFPWGGPIRGLISGLLVGWIKFIYIIVVPFIFYMDLIQPTGQPMLFIISFIMGVLATVFLQKFWGFKPFLMGFREVYAYSQTALAIFNFPNALRWFKLLFKGFIIKTLFLWIAFPFFLMDRLIGFMAVTCFLCVVIQKKFYPVHFFILYYPLSILSAELAFADHWTMPLTVLLIAISMGYLLPPLTWKPARLARYHWQQVNVEHDLADVASQEAADYIRNQNPGASCIFCWGRQLQLYFHLHISPPGPMPYFNVRNLGVKRVQDGLKNWAASHTPEYIFFPDLELGYYPIEILGALFDASYTFETAFCSGRIPLFKKKEEETGSSPSHKAFLKNVGLDASHIPYFTPMNLKNLISREDLERVASWARKRKGRPLLLWGDPEIPNIVDLFENAGMALRGFVFSNPTTQAFRGKPVFDQTLLEAGEEIAVIGGARSYLSTLSMMEICRDKAVPFEPLVDISVFDRILDEAGTSPYLFGESPEARFLRFTAQSRNRTLTTLPIESIQNGHLDALVQECLRGDRKILLAGDINRMHALMSNIKDKKSLIDVSEHLGFSFLPGKMETLMAFVNQRLGLDRLTENDRVWIIKEDGPISNLFHGIAKILLTKKGIHFNEVDHTKKENRIILRGPGLALSTFSEERDLSLSTN
jgi:hypothetical protein